MATLKANIIFRGKIECITGLHIGSGSEKLEIGGVDSPVIRHPHTQYPYIPGSSLKGKLRTMLEFALGIVSFDGTPSKDTRIVRLFGLGAKEKEKEGTGPTRIIVRDCHPDNETIQMWTDKVDSLLLYTEYKAENTLNRITSAANPRFIERVVPGSKFDFEMIYGVYAISVGDAAEKINEDISQLIQAMRLLEDSYLGKSGTRGYGKVKFHCAEPYIIKAEEYKNGNGNYLKYKEQPASFVNVGDLSFHYSE
ncbi:MAG TPA: type III-A CRISPR-associated RAMP protein Csm3 [Chitinophagales bacterium]|nr:type III-A CRISPR-associated RAMP protein Csm3 [Chitinophagales bacterium]